GSLPTVQHLHLPSRQPLENTPDLREPERSVQAVGEHRKAHNSKWFRRITASDDQDVISLQARLLPHGSTPPLAVEATPRRNEGLREPVRERSTGARLNVQHFQGVSKARRE